MILTCPNCASRFLLSAQALAPEGRRVKCSSCDEEWFQLPDPFELDDNIEHEIEDIPESVKPVPEGSSVPALSDGEVQRAESKTAMMAGYAGAAIVFLFIFAGLLAMKNTMLQAWPPSAAIYELVGMQVKAPGEGLVFDQVKARMTAPDSIVIEGQILNLTAEEQVLPAVETSIRNEAGDSIKKTVIHPPHQTMTGETNLPFKTSYQGEMDQADHVQVRFVLAKEKPKTVSEDAGNTPAPHADDHADPHGAAVH